MKKIFTLALNDFACSLRNKSFYLVFFIPIFIFVVFHFLDRSSSDLSKFKIGLIHQINYAPTIIKALQSNEKNVDVVWVDDAEKGRTLLKEHKVYGVLEESQQKNEQVALLVLQKDSPQTLALSQFFSNLQINFEKNNSSWISEIRLLRQGNMQRQTLPTWILMVVLLVAFIILPAQVAEEKEKKLLLALLQTPIHEAQWLLGKIVTGIFLSIISILLLQIFSQIFPANPFAFSSFIIIGSYCFSAFGIFLGLLCRNQASARTLGVVFYLPLLVPAALADFSLKMTGILPFVPSYHFYLPLQSSIFETTGSVNLAFSWFFLFLLGSTLFVLSYVLIKKRWLMS